MKDGENRMKEISKEEGHVENLLYCQPEDGGNRIRKKSRKRKRK